MSVETHLGIVMKIRGKQFPKRLFPLAGSDESTSQYHSYLAISTEKTQCAYADDGLEYMAMNIRNYQNKYYYKYSFIICSCFQIVPVIFLFSNKISHLNFKSNQTKF